MLKIIPFSGGYDSTLVLYQALKNGDKVHAHHIYLRNGENRFKAEGKACETIIKLLKKDFEFKYTHSTMEYYDKKMYGYDILTVGYMLTIIAERYLNRDSNYKIEINIGVPKDELEEGDWVRERLQRCEDMFTGCFKSTQYVIPKILYPISHLNKEQIINMIPQYLRKYCWTCRNPIDIYTPCGKCKSCLMIKGE